jgi:hypothetical protein
MTTSHGSNAMMHYRPQLPRITFALVAAAMTAVTIGTLGLAPAVFDAGYAPTATRSSPIEVAISPARIDVVGQREPDVAWAMPDHQKPNCKPEV